MDVWADLWQTLEKLLENSNHMDSVHRGSSVPPSPLASGGVKLPDYGFTAEPPIPQNGCTTLMGHVLSASASKLRMELSRYRKGEGKKFKLLSPVTGGQVRGCRASVHACNYAA